MTPDQVRNALTLAAHREAVRQLRTGASYATPLPTSIEVRRVLADLGVELDRDVVIAWVRSANLHLADMPAESAEDTTRKLSAQPSQR